MASIGNDLFRMWLKDLQPTARAYQMGEIAKSQAAKGLKGSAIKASLAQLSQRCRVMLIPLTEKEIHHLTRRSPADKLESNGSISKTKNVSPPLRQSGDEAKSNVKDQTTVSVTNCDSSNTDSKIKKVQNDVLPQSKKSYSSKKANENLKRKFEELFGHDPEETSSQQNISISSQNGKNVNYVSTTLHLNIFTNGSSKDTGSDGNEVGRKTPTVDKHKTKNLPKKLRIDVSLANNESHSRSNLNIAGIQISNESFESTTTCDKKKTKRKRSSSKSKAKRTKPKCAIPNISSTTNIAEEDSTIKELWSILGMESPTDRSESIKNGDSSKSVNQTNLANNSSTQTRPESQSSSSRGTEDTSSDSNVVCQISETFSLAHLPSDRPFLNFQSPSSSANLLVSEKCDSEYQSNTKGFIPIQPQDKSNKNKIIIQQDNVPRHRENCEIQECVVKSNQKLGSLKPCENNNVGKIRVKSMDALMNPVILPSNIQQLDSMTSNLPIDQGSPSTCSFPNSANPPDNTTGSTSVQNGADQNSGLGDTEQSKKYFFSAYQFYFNKSVNFKIPKLGEILHLAIGDEIRCKERIKAATQLSSQNFITEEKQRAYTDFRDVMKLRGEEFAPSFCAIFEAFEENSQITLFFALLYRILNHAIQIDSRHKFCISEAKTVILTMLSLSNVKAANILNILKSDFNEFEEQLNIISRLVDEYYLETTKTGHLSSSNRSEISDVITHNLTHQNEQTSKLSKGNDIRNSIQRNSKEKELSRNKSLSLHRSTSIPVVLPNTSAICAIPPYLQSRGHITANPPKGTQSSTVSNGTAKKDILMPPQVPSTNAKYVPVNKAFLPSSNSSTIALGKNLSTSEDRNHTVIHGKSIIQGTPSQVSKVNKQNNRTIAGNPVLARLLNQSGTTNVQVINQEVCPPNRNTGVIHWMPLNALKISTSSVASAAQLRPVSVLGNPNNMDSCSVLNRLSTKSSNNNQSLTPHIRTATNHANLNNTRIYQRQQTADINSASREIANERLAVPPVSERPPENLNTRDPLTLDNVQSQVVPSSSHCHPFVKRMPISGKMRMFFDSS